MCGIAGTFDLLGFRRVVAPDVERLIRAIAHRGPDRIATEIRQDTGLAFARLSINDIENGMQPVRSLGGSVISICNGAIVNWQELRAELETLGYLFQSSCDTEVVAPGYAEFGEKIAGRLRGQFALAAYDERDRSLLLARDPFGICPLFYTVVNGMLLFASEIKALLTHPAVSRAVDLTGLDQILTFPGPISPRTLFRGIYSLPPGHCLRASVPNAIRTWCYWDFRFQPVGDSIERPELEWLDEFDALFTESVGKRMQADVPAGLYLSGGLDSSLVGFKARASVGPVPIHSYSVDVREGSLSEGKYQRLAARLLQTEHCELALSAREVLERLRAVVYHTEAPIRESFNAATFAMSECVNANGQRLVLAGQGADELFAGYVGYRFDQVGRRGSGLSSEEAALGARLWGDAQFVYDGPLVPVREANRALFAPDLRRRYDEWCCLNDPPVDSACLEGFDALQRRTYLDIKMRLADHLLSGHGDRMASAHAVEVRYPFLDADIADFAARMPSQLKLNKLTEKYLLRRLAARYMPVSLANREKFAFTAPGSPSLLAEGGELIEHLLAPSTIRLQGYFDWVEVEKLKKQYSRVGFRLNVPFERDVLLVVLTFGLFLELFDLPNAS